MTFGDYVNGVFLAIGSAIIAYLMLRGMWFFVGYVFFGGDDAERAHMKLKLIHTAISLMFTMAFWEIFSVIGTALGV